MLDGIAGSLSRSPCSKRSTDPCTSPAAMWHSVLPREVPFARPFLDMGAVQALDVAGVEHPAHRAHRFELGAEGVEEALLQHAGVGRGFVGVVREDVPG